MFGKNFLGGRIFILCSFLLLSFCFLIQPAAAQEASLPEPYLLFPSVNGFQTPFSLPIITGETQNDTLIDVYIDGQLSGQAEVVNGPLFTAYFTFRPNKNLLSGDHTVYVQARDKAIASLMAASPQTKLYIIPFPKPTLFKITRYTDGRPLIQGVVKNDSLIKIYADNQLATSFPVVNHPSGTASFNWLAPTGAKFYATATDAEGKTSFNSNTLVFGKPPAASTAQKTLIDQPAPEIVPGETGGVKIIEQTPETATASTPGSWLANYQIWLGLILIAIIIIIIFWLKNNSPEEISGEITAAPIEPNEQKPEPGQASIFPAIKQEPLIKIPDQPVILPPIITKENQQSGSIVKSDIEADRRG